MPRQPATRAIFVLGSAAALCTLVWVSVETLLLEKERAESEAAAALEAEARLALWRMDSLVSPVVAAESSRPHFHYVPLYSPLKAFSPTWYEARLGETVVASPLLSNEPKYRKLYFELVEDDEFTSPQVLTVKKRILAEAHYVDEGRIERAEQRLSQLASFMRPADVRSAVAGAAVRHLVAGEAIRVPPLALPKTETAAQVKEQSSKSRPQSSISSLWRKSSRAPREYDRRQHQISSNQTLQLSNWGMPTVPVISPSAKGTMVLGEMIAKWYAAADGEPQLVLLRKVGDKERVRIQGVWLDWEALRTDLLAAIAEDFPDAKLRPRTWDLEDEDLPRALASIPAVLVPGPRAHYEQRLVSPARVAILAAWIAVGGAMLASGLALRASRQLSERRARFVSAVTHELRTPLTTFRLYTDMLSSEMVTDETKRAEYIGTLASEAERLGLLVENVLSYARLEEGRAKREPAAVPAGDMLERSAARAKERAESCGATLTVGIPSDVREATAIADEAAVEQIIFNLVDNACKHALGDASETAAIELDARRAGWHVVVRVRDHGPGIDAGMRGRLFEPFSRGEGVTAPGSGLGLALSRELARASGGELTHVAPRSGPGAAFELKLPLEIERA